MAQKVLVQLVDDLDGTSSGDVSTIEFGLDGVRYEIDLRSDNAAQLRKTYKDYIAAARRSGGRLRRGSRPANKPAEPSEAGKIREWALENGFELSGRGRLPRNVVEAYQDAQRRTQARPKKPAAARTGSAKRRVPARKA